VSKAFSAANNIGRRTLLRRLFLLCVLICSGISVQAEQVTTEIAIITHPQTKLERVSLEQIKKRWLSKTKRIYQLQVDIIDIDENNPLRHQFYSKIIGVNDSQLKAHWAKKVFRGEGLPPEMKPNYVEILQWVKKQANRIGYIYKKDIDDGVKILFEVN
tara:strand:- start:268 stop:744 length:477 start_codon:yes stop_codon:yes gene_type:complete